MLSDTVKETSVTAINRLKASGVRNIVMLTGDSEKAALSIAKKLGISRSYVSRIEKSALEKLRDAVK